MLRLPSVRVILLFGLILPASLLPAQATLDLIRKIKVDDKGIAGAVDGCAFNRAGDLVAASDNTGLTKVYRVADRHFITQVKHNEKEVSKSNGETNAIDFSTDDRYFLTGMNKTGCNIREMSTGKMIKNLGHGKNTDGAAFSPDGKWVAVAHRAIAAVYRLWDFEKVTEIPHPTKNECNSIDWSADSTLLVTGSDGACCKIIRTSDWKVLHVIDFGIDRVKSVRISPDGKRVAVSGQKARCRVYNTSDGQMIADLRHASDAKALPGDDDDGPEPNVEAVEWSADSHYLFTGGLYGGVIRVWRVADWSLVGWVQGQEYSRQVEYMAVNQCNILAAGGDEGYLYLFQFNPPPEKKLINQAVGNNGLIIIEAEDFDVNVPQGGHAWEVIKDDSASGSKKVQALPDNVLSGHGMDTNFQTGDPIKDSPKLDYRINITDPGTYYVWARAQGVDHYANSYHIGLNGLPVSTADRMENLSKKREWIWSNQTKDPERATLEIPNTGPVTLNLWMREDGVERDKIVLVKADDYTPKALGPKPDYRKNSQ